MAATKTHLGVASSGSLSVTLGPQGDCIIATVNWVSAPTSISNTGSALTWTLVCSGSWGSYGSYTYIAAVTAAAAGQTCTVSVAGGSVDFLLVDDISSGLGIGTTWALSNDSATNPSSSTTVRFSSVTTGSSGTLCYYGTAWISETISGGTTPVSGAAFTYAFYNTYLGVAFSGAVAPSTAYAPTATASSSATNASNGITLTASVSGVATATTIASTSTVALMPTAAVRTSAAVVSTSVVVAAPSTPTPILTATTIVSTSVVSTIPCGPVATAALIASTSVVVASPGLLQPDNTSTLITSISTVVIGAVGTPTPTPPAVSPSPRFLATALAADQTANTIVQVWTGPTADAAPVLLQDITKYCTQTGTTWGENETQSPRRTGSLTLESQGLLKDGLMPQNVGDLLHPLSGNEIRLYQGYAWNDGTSEAVPCGVYRISKPTGTDDDTKVEIVITLNDRASEVSRRSWVTPYVISGAPTIDQAILAAMESVWPGLTYNLEPSTNTIDDITFGTQGYGATSNTSATDPMADLSGLCTPFNMELFFDESGILVLRTIPVPTTVAIGLVFEEGVSCTMNEVAREFDETLAYNGVVATSTAPGVEFPVQETVWITDPANPFNPDNYGAEVPYFYSSPYIITDDDAIAAATSQLQTIMVAYDLASFTAVMNASLKCGDGVRVVRARLGLNNVYCVTETSFSSDNAQGMQITLRSQMTPDGS